MRCAIEVKPVLHVANLFGIAFADVKRWRQRQRKRANYPPHPPPPHTILLTTPHQTFCHFLAHSVTSFVTICHLSTHSIVWSLSVDHPPHSQTNSLKRPWYLFRAIAHAPGHALWLCLVQDTFYGTNIKIFNCNYEALGYFLTFWNLFPLMPKRDASIIIYRRCKHSVGACLYVWRVKHADPDNSLFDKTSINTDYYNSSSKTHMHEIHAHLVFLLFLLSAKYAWHRHATLSSAARLLGLFHCA